MDKLRIDDGTKRISIEDNEGKEKGILVFNPSDLLFAEKFYRLISEYREKMNEYSGLITKVEAENELDSDGLPVNAEERITVLKKVCTYTNSKIDQIFGEGTASMLFGDTLSLSMYLQFFDGITPFFEKARSAKTSKYVKRPKSK